MSPLSSSRMLSGFMSLEGNKRVVTVNSDPDWYIPVCDPGLVQVGQATRYLGGIEDSARSAQPRFSDVVDVKP